MLERPDAPADLIPRDEGPVHESGDEGGEEREGEARRAAPGYLLRPCAALRRARALRKRRAAPPAAPTGLPTPTVGMPHRLGRRFPGWNRSRDHPLILTNKANLAGKKAWASKCSIREPCYYYKVLSQPHALSDIMSQIIKWNPERRHI